MPLQQKDCVILEIKHRQRVVGVLTNDSVARTCQGHVADRATSIWLSLHGVRGLSWSNTDRITLGLNIKWCLHGFP